MGPFRDSLCTLSWWALCAVVYTLSAPTGAVAADCNSNGVEDSEDIQKPLGLSEDCNVNGIPDECEGVPFHFGATRTILPVAGPPVLLRTVDLNGDGLLDIVAGSAANNTSKVTVFSNNGAESFAAVSEQVIEGELHSLSIDDFDDDGDLDCAVANSTVILILDNSGDANFELPVGYPLPTRFLISGDLSGDGFADLIVADDGSNTISVLTNDGHGFFSLPRAIDVGNDPSSIALGYFDNDDRLDLATVNETSRDYSILINDGAGNFKAAMNYPVDGNDFPPGDFTSSLHAADYNGDGVTDLAVTTSNAISLVVGNGDGTFAEAVTLFEAATSLTVGDFDSDNDIDLAVTVPPDHLIVRVNDGFGSFAVSSDFALDFAVDGLPAVTAGDWNGDSADDIAIATTALGAASVLWNSDDPVQGQVDDPPEDPDDQMDIVVGAFPVSTQTIVFEACSDVEQGCRPHSGGMADLDMDGDLDLVGSGTHPSEFLIALNEGNGNYVPQPSYAFGGVHAQSVAVADIDSDGDSDLLTVDNLDHMLYVHESLGDGTFNPPRLFKVDNAPINVQVGDFDGDGDLDAVTANRTSLSVMFNDGAGNFAPVSQRDYPVERNPLAATVGDFDDDGDADIASANSIAKRITVLLNDGKGGFPKKKEYGLLGTPNHIDNGDVNGDGSVDLVAAINNEQCASVLLNRDNGRGDFVVFGDFDIGYAPYSLLLVDFDGDDRLDLLTANDASSTVSFLKGNGDGTFQSGADVVHTAVGEGPRLLIAGDLDNDGDVDVASVNRIGESITVFHNRNTQSQPPAEDPDENPDDDFLESICTPAEYRNLAREVIGFDPVKRFVKYLLPISDQAALRKTVFQNTKRFPLHEDLLRNVFVEEFPVLTPEVYSNLVGVRATRQYFVGAVSRILTEKGLVYGFSVVADFADPVERLSAAEVHDLYEQLRLSFRLEPFAYAPNSPAATGIASQWQNPGFPIILDGVTASGPTYVPYTKGVAFGRVRLLTVEEFDQINNNGDVGFQDIYVVTQTPRDVDGVPGGFVTAELQGELSHLSVRTARRGTPNAYVKKAVAEFAPFEGQLVRLEIDDFQYAVRLATTGEAENFWASHRPRLSVLPSVDPDFREFSSLSEIAAMDRAGGEIPMEARFGGKATNLARLQPILTPGFSQYQERGFAIPVFYYLDFMRSNRIPSALTNQLVTYEEYVRQLFSNQMFQTNSSFRFRTLKTLRDTIREVGRIDPNLVVGVANRILDVLGTPPNTRVRFRSSSTSEDAMEFPGAGLYDSTSGCAADDFDSDDVGPSHCDPTKSNERGITRALKKVWASNFNFGAVEERIFYGIPPELSAMAVLVNRTFIDENSNGVVFTGNPTNPLDRRFVVTVQVGENSVVNPAPGVLAEKDLLEVDGGSVVEIIRAVPSSLVPPENVVLSDAKLVELGSLIWHIEQNFPIDTGPYGREEILLDLEVKEEANGDLAVKQIRPFLLTAPRPPAPTFELLVPPHTLACGNFDPGRSLPDEYKSKSTIRFVEGSVSLPAGVNAFTANLIEEILVGPDREVATPTGPGLFKVTPIQSGGGRVIFRFDYEQDFLLPEDTLFELELSQVDFVAVDGAPVQTTLVMDETFLTDELVLSARFERDRLINVFYSSCEYDALPLWAVQAEFADGTNVYLEERYRAELFRDIGPAALRYGEIHVGAARRWTADYWELVYSATRHNEHVGYWIVFNPPLVIPGVSRPVHGVELTAPVPNDFIDATASYFDENLEVITPVEVVSYQRQAIEVSRHPQGYFRRGDVNADGSVDFSDAIKTLRVLFLGEGTFSCEDAADSNGDNVLDLSDAMTLLFYLFLGRNEIPSPGPDACGLHRTPDPFTCDFHPPCG